jgi:hypothetical protein
VAIDRHLALPPGVYGGDVVLDVDGHGVVVHGIEGLVHVFMGPNEGRSLQPKDARILAQTLLEAADMMELFPPPRTEDEEAGDAARRTEWAHAGAIQKKRAVDKGKANRVKR